MGIISIINNQYASNMHANKHLVRMLNTLCTVFGVFSKAQISKVSQIRSLIGTTSESKQRDNVIGKYPQSSVNLTNANRSNLLFYLV